MNIGFGHDFSAVRAKVAAYARHQFYRRPNPQIENCLPETYGKGPAVVAARKLNDGKYSDHRSIVLEIGETAVRQLIKLEVAEINVAAGLSDSYAAHALSLLAANWERLTEPGPGKAGCPLFLSTCHQECTSYIKAVAEEASSRLDGENFWRLYQQNMGQHPRLGVETREVQYLLRDLNLPSVTRNLDPRNNTVVAFDLLRVFRNGAYYHGVVHLPLELVLAEVARAGA